MGSRMVTDSGRVFAPPRAGARREVSSAAKAVERADYDLFKLRARELLGAAREGRGRRFGVCRFLRCTDKMAR